MIEGILLSLASGLLFGGVGVVLRRVSRAGGSLVTCYVLFGACYLALALAFQVRWRLVAGAERLPLRVALSAAGFLAVMLVLFLFAKDRRPGRLVPLLALAHGAIGFLGQAAFFASLDRLAPLGLAAAAFPVSIGTTILSFSLYSALVLRERFRALDIASLAAGSAGIALLALST